MQRDFFKKVFTGRRNTFALSMAPMIDMTFLLLIFFLVAAKWRPQEDFLPFQLPAAQAAGQTLARPEPLIIQIHSTHTGCQVQIGQIYTVQIEDRTIEANLAALMEKLRQCLLEQKRYTTDPIEIACGEDVKWEHLAKIYNMLFGVGLTDITFIMTE